MRASTGLWEFQSTLLREERLATLVVIAVGNRISIHAPTRGATLVVFYCKEGIIFQSMLLREERLPMKFKTDNAYNFNPRSYERSDEYLHNFCNYSSHFNPRSYERSDKSKSLTDLMLEISIHAPTRGATNK